ncbi:MAG: DUF4864 domain-containing protein [Pseudomonadota bacterium]
MRAALVGAALWILAAGAASADPKAMQSVIDQQLEAFQADDFSKAMEFASPVLQRYFRTPENFGRMVTQGYPMVWRPGDVRYLENRIEDGVHWQRVMITDRKGQTHVLDYRMTETADGWKINGVMILDASDFTA